MAKRNGKITAQNEGDDPSQPFNNSRWELFIQNLIKGDSFGEAYIKAGFDVASNEIASAAANRLLKNVKIANRVEYLKKQAEKAMIADVSEIMRNMTEITRISPFEALQDPKKYGKYIDSVTFETQKVKEEYVDKNGEVKTRTVSKRAVKKVNLVSKAKMYQLIGQYYSMFTDKVNISGELNQTVQVSLSDFKSNMKKAKD